jgi:hypothetical protein
MVCDRSEGEAWQEKPCARPVSGAPAVSLQSDCGAAVSVADKPFGHNKGAHTTR